MAQTKATARGYDEAIAAGVRARTGMPRRAQAQFERVTRDPMLILEHQNETRVPRLVQLRMERMAASAFAFFRGTAALMAADLAEGRSTDIDVVSCGDAHISNFGLFASPQRTLVFDLNDFDEAAIGPWEWDVKRMVTSIIIGGRDAGHPEADTRRSALEAAGTYRQTVSGLMKYTAADRYYARIDVDDIRRNLDEAGQKVLDRTTAEARRRTSEQFATKMSRLRPDGGRVFTDDPPVLTHLPDSERLDVEGLFSAYRQTVAPDVALLLSQYTLTDVAMRVVGVGSVGTRCFIVMLTGPHGESFVLQIKEAPPSVLATYGRRGDGDVGGSGGSGAGATGGSGAGGGGETHQGRRVVTSQRILQAVSDPFLGHLSLGGRDFYVRQFRDMKGTIDLAGLGVAAFRTYVGGCAIALGRAHAQSPNAGLVAGYLGSSARFDEAVVEWSLAYAEQSLADYHCLLESRSGR